MSKVNITVYIYNTSIYIGGVTDIRVEGDETIYTNDKGNLAVKTAEVLAVQTINA